MSRQLEDRIAAVSARQHGVITHAQLLEAGLSPSAVDRRLRGGRLRRIHRGVYLTLPFPLTWTPEMAAVLATGPGSLLSHGSAARLWGMPAPPPSPEVEVKAAGHRWPRPGIVVHRVRRLDKDERADKEGIPLTTPGRTIVDLAAVWTKRELEAAIAWAERERLVTLEELSALTALHVGRRGMRVLAALLQASAGLALTRSAAEEQFLALVREGGLPPPACNVRVGRFEIDFLWRSAGIAVEVDGFRYHSSRSRFEGDRRRDAELLAAGITVLRLSWGQITRTRVATAVQLTQALDRAVARR